MICLLGNMRHIVFYQNMMIQFPWKTAMICLCLKFTAGLMSMRVVIMAALAPMGICREADTMGKVMAVGMAVISGRSFEGLFVSALARDGKGGGEWREQWFTFW